MRRHQLLLRISLGFVLILVVLLGVRIVPAARAADPSPVVGDWEGQLDPGAQPKKKVVVHITADPDGTLGGTIDYPDQSVSGAKITAIHYKQPSLHFENTAGEVAFDGTISKDSTQIAGTWKQGAAPLSLTLTKVP